MSNDEMNASIDIRRNSFKYPSIKSGGNLVKTGTYFVMYTIINVVSIIDTQIVVIFDEEFGITPKDDNHTQLININGA